MSKNNCTTNKGKFKWIEDWGNRKVKSLQLAECYQKFGDEKLIKKAWKVRTCGNILHFDSCQTMEEGHTKRLKSSMFCSDRLCAICNRKRAMKVISSLVLGLKPYLVEEYKIIFMSLTIRNTFEIDKSVYQNFLQNWIKFQQNFLLGRTREKGKHIYKGPCVGGVMTLETTYNPKEKNGLLWHPHLHGLLVCRDWIDQKAASESWQKVTGNSKIVGFQKVEVDMKKGVIDGVVEVCKYLAKIENNMPPEAVCRLAIALRNVRCMNAFGVLKSFMVEGEKLKKEMERGCKCEICGANLIDITLRWFAKKYHLEDWKFGDINESDVNMHSNFVHAHFNSP